MARIFVFEGPAARTLQSSSWHASEWGQLPGNDPLEGAGCQSREKCATYVLTLTMSMRNENLRYLGKRHPSTQEL